MLDAAVAPALSRPVAALPALSRLAPGPLALADDAHWLHGAETAAARALALADADRSAIQGIVWSDEADALLAQGWKPYDMAGRVAVIPVSGLIVPELGLMGAEWATGCAELRWQIAAALADPAVAAIALRVNSGGGYVSGVDETAAAIRAARDAKPVAAVVNDSAYSAAYWLASAADTIACAPMGGVGHVGVIAMHVDMRGMLQQMGVTARVFHSGARKADLHPFVALSDAAATDFQTDLDAVRGVFAASVAAGRRNRPDAAAVLATEAFAYSGPAFLPQALTLGLIDAVIPADQALAAFVQAHDAA